MLCSMGARGSNPRRFYYESDRESPSAACQIATRGGHNMSGKGKPLNIVIGVPSIRGTIMTHTCAALIKTTTLLNEIGVKTNFINVDSAEITTVRNSIASYVTTNEDFTHLLFIDDDMTFEGDTIIDMLRANKDVIGAVCPRRILMMDAFYEHAKAGRSLDECMAAATSFVARYINTDKIEIKEGIFPLRGIGMAVTLLKRDVLMKMVATDAVVKRTQPEAVGPDSLGNMVTYSFFDAMPNEDGSNVLSEDYSFCERWISRCGGEVWGMANRKIGHIGPYIYAGTYLDRLKMGLN